MSTQGRRDAVRLLALIAVVVCGACSLAPLAAGEATAKKPKTAPTPEAAPTSKAAPAAPVTANQDNAVEQVMSLWETRVHAALRRESSAKDAAREPAVRDLVALYESLEKAKGIDQEERTELRGLVRNRLLRVSQRISKRLEKTGKKSAAVLAADAVAQSSGSAADAAAPSSGSAPQAGPGNSAGGQPTASGGRGGQQGPADYGLELVELIQHTIAPQSWDVNGGNGTIIYFSPRHAIVVRQTDDVHEDLGGVLRGLRD